MAWNKMVSGKFKGKLWESLFLVVIWSLWFERNGRKFNNSSKNVAQLFETIKFRLGEWIVCYAPKFTYSISQVVHNIQAVWRWKG